MSPDDARHQRPMRDLSAEQASTLLRLGLRGLRRPVDDLIERLRAGAGLEWLERALARVLGGASPAAALAGGGADVAELTAIKEHCKAILRDSRDTEERLAAIAGYFLSIAAGLAHHGARIGGHGRDDLNEILLDLADVAPGPYSSLLATAAIKER
jgi:hypothetical protein